MSKAYDSTPNLNMSDQGQASFYQSENSLSYGAPQTYLSMTNHNYHQRSGILTDAFSDENERVALPVYCGFEEEELLSE